MQGQRSIINSFAETMDIEQGAASNSSGMNEQTSLNNMLNSVESRLSNYAASSSEATCLSGIDHEVQSLSGCDRGESSRLNLRNQASDGGMRPEHGWTSLFNAHAGAEPRSEERKLETTNTLYPGNYTGFGGNQVTERPFFLQSSGTNYIPQNLNLNGSNSINGNPGTGAGVSPTLYKTGGLDTEQIASACVASDNVGTSSGNSGYIVDENNGASSSNLAGWGLSCKRKILEGTSGPSNAGGSSSSFPQAENDLWNAGPARVNASSSLTLSTSPWNSPSIGPPEQLNPRTEIGITGVASDAFPSLIVTGNVESPLTNFGRRVNQGNQQESVPSNLSSAGSTRHSNVCTPHQSLRSMPPGNSMELRTTVGAANSSASQNPSPVVHVYGLPRNLHSFPWSGDSSSRVGSSSNSRISGERTAALREETSSRANMQNSAEHPMFVPATETRNLAQDPTSWSLASGNMGHSSGVPPIARFGPSSSINPLPTSAWTPRHNPPLQNQQRSSGFTTWSLIPSVDPESGVHNSHFSLLPSVPSASSQETAVSSGANSQRHHQPFPGPAVLMERHGDDVLGMPLSLRALAVDIEGRHRLISEIRQVLNAMRRDENLRVEDYMVVDPFIYHGMAEINDRHRDMRLDVDNMSYEELLALEERIGDVSTGLSVETILKFMKQRANISSTTECQPDLEPCCICREEYSDGDYLGTLECGHDFHSDCIKQWLMQKNLCPICKTTALST